MGRTVVVRSRSRGAARPGRPPRELAGEVDERILEAARKVFVERGFEGASIEEIAKVARAGKPTIYARFPSKETLFIAAHAHYIATMARFENYTPTGATIEERLASIGATVLERILVSETVGLIRTAIAEARRFPDLAARMGRAGRERGAEAVAHLLAELAKSNELANLPAFEPHRIASTTKFFLDLVILPMLMRALVGEDHQMLRAEIGPHVSQAAVFFLAACRHGGVR